MDGQKSQFVQSEQLAIEIKKLSQSVKTSLEEAKFDTVQMVQNDIVEVTNQQKDSSFKAQELSGKIDEVRSQMQEAV